MERELNTSDIGDHVGGAQDVDDAGRGDDGAAMVDVGQRIPEVH